MLCEIKIVLKKSIFLKVRHSAGDEGLEWVKIAVKLVGNASACLECSGSLL